jgi:hypothetical protein
VCAEFADQLEQRRADLRTLFPPPAEPLVAELLPPLPPAPVRSAGDGGKRPRRRRAALVPVLLALLLVGAAIATAVALNDSGGGKQRRAAVVGGTGAGTAGAQAHGGAKVKPHGAKPHAAAKRPAAKPHARATAKPAGGTTAKRATPCRSDPATLPAQSGYSGRAGATQVAVDPCAHASRAGAGLASTGLDLKPVVAAGLLLLGLGFGLRRLGRRTR